MNVLLVRLLGSLVCVRRIHLLSIQQRVILAVVGVLQ